MMTDERRPLRLAVALLAGLTACSGDAPTTPPTTARIPTAVMMAEGEGRWVGCDGGECFFEGDARNTGPGCAANVTGVTWFFDGADWELGYIHWAVAGVVPPDTVVAYGATAGPVGADIVFATRGYRTEMSWSAVPCP